MVLLENKQERRNQSKEGIGLVSKDLDSLLQNPNLIYIIYPLHSNSIKYNILKILLSIFT